MAEERDQDAVRHTLNTDSAEANEHVLFVSSLPKIDPTASLPSTPHKQPKATSGSSASHLAAKRMLRRLVQGEQPPTQPLSIVDRLAGSPYANPMIQVQKAVADDKRKTLDFALNLGETMFRYGAGALEVETSLIAVTAAFGLQNVDLDITNQSVIINYQPPSQTPITVMRVVRSWTSNYAGLAQIHQLVSHIVDGEIDRVQAKIELRDIVSHTKPYAKWMVTAAIGVFAAAIAAFIGGDWLTSIISAIVIMFVHTIQRVLAKLRVPDFYSTASAAFFVTIVAEGMWLLHVPAPPSLVVAGGILLLLPAGRLVTATQDAINGFPVTAAGRFLSAFLTFTALVAGISVGLVFGQMMGTPKLDVTATYANNLPPLVLMVLVMIAVAAVCVVEQSSPVLMIPSMVVGALGYLVMVAASSLPFLGFRFLPALSAVIIGFLARFIALKMGAPQLVVAIPATLFLYNGLAIFRAMYSITTQSSSLEVGVIALFNALTIILAIAAGLVLGDNLARPLTRSLNSNERRRRRRR